MKLHLRAVVMGCATLLALGQFASVRAAGELDKYVWETPRASNIDRQKAGAMTDELGVLVQQVLDAGPLAPLRMAYADIPFEAYFLYYERGRIITTLAYAYPHVTAQQQAGIKQYVRKLLADDEQSPWTAGILKKGEGAERRLYKTPMNEGRFIDWEKKAIPTLHVLYGLWLYADRTGDWDPIKQNWEKIRSHYTKTAATEVFLYGQMSAHIGMARMARQVGG